MSAKASDANRPGGSWGGEGETSSHLQSEGKKVVQVARVVKEWEEAAANAAKGGSTLALSIRVNACVRVDWVGGFRV